MLQGVYLSLKRMRHRLFAIMQMQTKEVFPGMDLKKQLGALYASTFLSGLRLTDAVWVALLAARGFALWEIGLAEAVYHIISLVFEVPSGMAADLLGRRRTYLLGGLLALAQDVTMLLANDLPMVCLAMGLGALSGSMYSGTSSALVYDSLVQTHCTERYLSVSARLDQLGLAAGGLGAVISAAQPLLGYTGLYLSSGACNALSAAADIFLTEPVVTQAQAQRDSFALRQLPKRFFRQAQQSLAALRQCPAAIRVILADGVVCVPCYLVTMFLQQRLVQLGWPTALLFVPHLLSRTAAFAGSVLGCRLRVRRLTKLYIISAGLCGLGTVLVGLAETAGALAGAALVQGVLSAWMLHADRQMNEYFPSDLRATLVSVDSMAYSLMMIPASPLVGWIGDQTGQAGAGLAVLGCLISASALLVWLRSRRAERAQK